jgi:hypothetical protein
MPIDKKRRVAFASGFLVAILAAVKAVADATVFWPLSALWEQLRGPQRFQFAAGCGLAVVMLVLFFVARSREA